MASKIVDIHRFHQVKSSILFSQTASHLHIKIHIQNNVGRDGIAYRAACSVGTRWSAVGTPQKHHSRHGSAVTSPCCGKCETVHFIFGYFPAIPWRSEKFHIAVPMPWDRGRV